MTRQDTGTHILPQVEAQLRASERLLWIGQPSPRRMLRRPIEGVELFSMLILTIVAVALLVTVLLTGAFGSPNVLSGLLVALLVSAALVPLLGQYLTAKRLIYAVTTHRALIINGSHVQSFGAADINCLEQRPCGRKYGDVIFKRVVRERWLPNGYTLIPATVTEEVGFFGIEDAEHVADLLRDALSHSPIAMWQEPSPRAQTAEAA